MPVININKNNFQNEIMDSEKTVLLDFWAPWLERSMWMSNLNWQVNLEML